VGVWILAGCLLKALYGSPADLPPAVRALPFALPTTFLLVLGVEAFVGLGTLLRPGRFWPLAALLLVTVAAVAGSQVAAGASSCGCFGKTVTLAPATMLAIDLGLLLVLFAARPWRLLRGGPGDVVALVLALVAAGAVVPTVAAQAEDGPQGPRYVVLEPKTWVGQPIRETTLAAHADLARARDGVWVLYRDSCEMCAECLALMKGLEYGARELTLVRLSEPPSPDKPPHVHEMPNGAFARRIDLPVTQWVCDAPTWIVVEGGVVKEVRSPVPPADCR
jgi:hypothetical protein